MRHKAIKYIILTSSLLFISLIATQNYSYAYKYCGIGETYDSLTDSCKCMYGYVRTYTGCISEDRACKNTYGYGAKTNYLGSCECSSGYIMSNGRCELGVTYCSTKYGLHSNFDFLNQSCDCSPGYVFNTNGNRCISLDESCAEEYGYGSESDSITYNSYSGLDCRCKNGYLWNSTQTQCIDANQRCREILGWNASYDTLSNKCECNDSYVYLEGINTCVSEEEYCEDLIGYNSNYIGDYECSCNEGYVLDPNTELCISEQEYCNTTMDNSHYEGDYTCVCDYGYVFDERGNTCISEEVFCESYFGSNTQYVGYSECGCLGGYHWGDDGCVQDVMTFVASNTASKAIFTVLLVGILVIGTKAFLR